MSSRRFGDATAIVADLDPQCPCAFCDNDKAIDWIFASVVARMALRSRFRIAWASSSGSASMLIVGGWTSMRMSIGRSPAVVPAS